MTVRLHKEIERLKKKILAISAEVDQAIEFAMRAFKNRDLEQAQKVIDGDVRIDQMEVELEEDCLKVLALHQPVAIDLRYVVAILKINNDLERIADQAVNIAERAKNLAGEERIPYPEGLNQMLSKTHGMLREALESLIHLDGQRARHVIDCDDEVDDLNRSNFKLLMDKITHDPQNANSYITLLSLSRHLERIADQVTNIAEDVIYLVEGEIVRHSF